MEDYLSINKFLCENTTAKMNHIENRMYSVTGLSMPKVRDLLFKLGEIQKEDLKNNTYIAMIPGGLFKKNCAVVLLELKKDQLRVAAYAEEGLINQHTVKGVLNELEENIKQYICEN